MSSSTMYDLFQKNINYEIKLFKKYDLKLNCLHILMSKLRKLLESDLNLILSNLVWMDLESSIKMKDFLENEFSRQVYLESSVPVCNVKHYKALHIVLPIECLEAEATRDTKTKMGASIKKNLAKLANQPHTCFRGLLLTPSMTPISLILRHIIRRKFAQSVIECALQ